MFALVRSPRLGTDNICNLIVHRLDAGPQHHLSVADVLQSRFDADGLAMFGISEYKMHEPILGKQERKSQ